MVKVAWEAVPCPQQRGPIAEYIMRYSNGTSIATIMGEGNRQYNVTGLTPYTNYTVQVAAVNGVGQSVTCSSPMCL